MYKSIAIFTIAILYNGGIIPSYLLCLPFQLLFIWIPLNKRETFFLPRKLAGEEENKKKSGIYR
jgi:hypothetical protein